MSLGKENVPNPSPSDLNGSISTTFQQTTSATDGPPPVRENAKAAPTNLIVVQSEKDVPVKHPHNQSSSVLILPGNSQRQNNNL